MALHVSNRHLNLVSVVAATAGTLPGVKSVLAEDRFQTSTPDKLPSLVVYLSQSETTLAEVRKLRFAKPMPASDLTPWADDFGNILEALWKGPF